jgi:hypothetical protein
MEQLNVEEAPVRAKAPVQVEARRKRAVMVRRRKINVMLKRSSVRVQWLIMA